METLLYPNKIFTIGFFHDISGAEEELAKSVLDSAQNSGSYSTTTSANLNGIYTQIFNQLLWAAKAIPGSSMITDTIATGFTYVTGSLAVSKETASISGQVISWPLDYINTETVTLTYSLLAQNSVTCGVHKSSDSWIYYQNTACTDIKTMFPKPKCFSTMSSVFKCCTYANYLL